MSEWVQAYLGLGANLSEPVAQIRSAERALKALPQSRALTLSCLYGSTPMGPQDQPDYVNAVAALETRLPALELLDALQDIEREHGRVRNGERWGARTLDVDLLLYGQERIDHPRLQVPHVGAHLRIFVLKPLFELAPALQIPGRGNIADLLAARPQEGLWLLEQ